MRQFWNSLLQWLGLDSPKQHSSRPRRHARRAFETPATAESDRAGVSITTDESSVEVTEHDAVHALPRPGTFVAEEPMGAIAAPAPPEPDSAPVRDAASPVEFVKPTSELHERLSPPQLHRTPRSTVIVGLDFGTHSTKVVVRTRGDKNARIITIDDSTQGYPWFASPSLVRLSRGRLTFGRDALDERRGGVLYRSLKVHLLPPTEDLPIQFPLGPSPDLLVACYLAWALQRIRWNLAKRGEPNVILNLAAPMDHIENEGLRTRYLHVAQAAWESAFGANPLPIEQNANFDDIVRPMVRWLEREPPEAAERRYEILPETVAPIVSLSIDPRMAPGMYAIFDMGAGTTEISVNHVNEPGADQRVLCYADESILVGGDNFQLADQQIEHGSVGNGGHAPLLRSITKAHKRVWHSGYSKDSENYSARQRWRELTVLLTGGGGRRQDVANAISQANPILAWPTDETTYVVDWHQPTGIDFEQNLTSAMNEDIPLLAVAHGLSLERQKWPNFFCPRAIERPPPSEVIASPPAFWYVEGK